jgi:hypothetical protein
VKTILLMSILISAVVIPTLAARDPNPRRALKRMVVALVLFNAAYLAYVTLVHPVVFVPVWGGE